MEYTIYLRLEPVEMDYVVEAEDLDEALEKVEDSLTFDESIPKEFKKSHTILLVQDDKCEDVYTNEEQYFLDDYEEKYYESR
jgi:hypothetical protein